MLEAVIDAFIDVAKRHAVCDASLARLEEGAGHTQPLVRGAAITRLTVLTHYFEEAAAVLARLCRHSDEGVRLFAVSALANTPADVGRPLVEDALEDASWAVRKAAAQAAGAVVWPALLPILEARAGAEADARVGVVLSLAIDFHRASEAAEASDLGR